MDKVSVIEEGRGIVREGGRVWKKGKVIYIQAITFHSVSSDPCRLKQVDIEFMKQLHEKVLQL